MLCPRLRGSRALRGGTTAHQGRHQVDSGGGEAAAAAVGSCERRFAALTLAVDALCCCCCCCCGVELYSNEALKKIIIALRLRRRGTGG